MMKLVRFTFFVAAVLAVAASLSSAATDTAVQVDVLADDGDRVVLRYELGEFTSRPIEIEGQSWDELALSGEPTVMQRGAPALPLVHRSVIVPDAARMAVTVLDSESYEIFAKIAPSKGTLSRSVDPADVPYEFGEAYAVNAFFPHAVAELSEPYILRDHRAVVVKIRPFRYNPVTGVLRIYTRLTLEVASVGNGTVNVLDRTDQPRRGSRAFDAVYRSQFVNFASPAYSPIDEDGEMLIIAHDPWIANLAPFVAHKAGIGITATVVGVSTIGNNASSIASYIESVYAGSNLAYVLLVGDVAQISTPMVLGGGSDPSYAKLTGNDDYPEIIVGRFSASTAAEVDTQVARTIAYETAPATEQAWFWKGIGIASAEGAGIGDEGQSDKQHQGEIRDWLMAAGYTDVDEIYDPGASAGQVTSAVNAGRGVINYTGHGWPDGWGTTGFDSGDVNALTNDGMLPFIVSVACNNGEFESYASCFAESWMRATNGGTASGAVGVYASSISQYWAEPMEGQDEFNLLLTDPTEPYHSLGALCFAASSSMMDAYGQAGVDMFDTWILFGDPSLRVVGAAAPSGLLVEPPTGITVHGPPGGPFGPTSFVYQLNNLEDAALQFTAGTREPWLSVSTSGGTIPPLGSVQVTVTVHPAAFNFDNGVYSGDVDFVNLTDHKGDTTRAASLSVGIRTLHYASDLDTPPSWPLEGRWQYGYPTGGGGVYEGNPDPVGGATGDNVFGVSLYGDYPGIVGGPYSLTAGPFDLTGVYGASLGFERWLNIQGMPLSSAALDASADGVAWSQIWSNSDGIADDAWTTQTYDIGTVVDGSSNAFLRWSYGVLSAEAVPCSGWNIDDLEIWAIPAGTARITLVAGADTLSWTPVASAVAYDVVTGSLDTLRATGGDFAAATTSCPAPSVGVTTVAAPEDPLPGTGTWFLVRGRTADAPITYQALYDSQQGLRDAEINTSLAACP